MYVECLKLQETETMQVGRMYLSNQTVKLVPIDKNVFCSKLSQYLSLENIFGLLSMAEFSPEKLKYHCWSSSCTPSLTASQEKGEEGGVGSPV